MHTFADPLRRALTVAPDEIAVVSGDHRLTYAQTWDRCCRLAGALFGLGLQPGDRVAIVAANSHRYLEAYYAVPAAGLVLVPLNARWSGPELRYALADSQTRVLITDRESSDLADVVEHIVQLPDAYEALIDGAPLHDLGVGVHENDLAGLFYTGGTTGASKGVMLTHRNLIANAQNMQAVGRLTAEDSWLVVAPLFHAAGTVAALATVWVAGRHVVLGAFDPAAALDLIERERVTTTLAVPTMLAAITDEQLARPRDVSSMRMLSHGGAPCATEVLRRTARAFPGAELIHLYGATETAPIATTFPHEERHLETDLGRSCGQPAVGVDVKVVDADGKDVGPGTVGEIVIRGPNVMQGYWNKPEQTEAALHDGWYRSGDLGYADERSFVFLVDRAKDMIVTGAENVYSTEVEEALYTHPAIAEAAVFGVPDERWGEAVYAMVVLREPATAEELQQHCRERIAGYKVPKQIVISDDPLPKSGAGKILKREIREPYWQGRTARVG
ncbi:MAG: class I adenylate-forming enzyme family protein [Ilumatobacteraceae bacterium]